MDIVTAGKVKLIKWLRNDSMILEYVQSRGLITQYEYATVESTNDVTEKTKKMINFIVGKGDKTCFAFLKLLKEGNVNESSPELREWIATVNTSSGTESGTAVKNNSSQAATQNITDHEAFFKDNLCALIQKVKNVDCIIDSLEFHDEMVSNIKAERTVHAKMRKILDYTKTKKAYERLYNALKAYEQELMEELES